MTSFDIAALTPELNRTIACARIDNIYQINPTTLLLKLRQPNQPSIHLLIEAGKRLHLTSYAIEKPKRPTAFCMALRKHLRNSTVTRILQHEFERIITIQMNTGKGDFQLIAEMFSRGNLILVDPNNKILHALRYRRMRDRKILRGESFQHPPPRGRNPHELTISDFKVKALGQLEIVKGLTKFLSIGGLYAEEILLRAGVSNDTACESLTKQEMDRILDEIHQILSSIETGKVEPQIVIDERGVWIDAIPIFLKKFAHLRQEPYNTVNEAFDEYYTRIATEESAADVSKETEQKLAKQQRILIKQQNALKDSAEKIEQYQEIGDVIYTHFSELQSLLQEIASKKREGESWTQIISDIKSEKKAGRVPAIHFHSLQPERLTLNVSVDDLIFPLNIRRSIQVNAADYYKKAKKTRKKLDGVKKALGETKTRISRLPRQQVELAKKAPKLPTKRRKRDWFEKFRWFHSSDGFFVLGGRDATTNELLIKRHMEPHDVVFHADIVGAPFVLVKTEGKQPPEQTISESAQFAASYSRAWRAMLDVVNVYWVSPQQVTKGSPPAKRGAFAIRKPKNYVRNVPLQVAIGIQMKNEHPIVIGGPPKAISQHTTVYVEIVPGNQKSGELAKHIRLLLAKRLPEAAGKRILLIPLEEVQRFIPLGRGTTKPSKF
ncbi:MAG: NFACT family protein [Candidatus Bathyarchaeota archaeon]|nr:MAG: NFACT family protein [Candidatus Bathyarchaeota archaeon]